jgi:hypothetical protein
MPHGETDIYQLEIYQHVKELKSEAQQQS